MTYGSSGTFVIVAEDTTYLGQTLSMLSSLSLVIENIGSHDSIMAELLKLC